MKYETLGVLTASVPEGPTCILISLYQSPPTP